ncbi:MAG: glutamate synthase [Hyphomicrobiales bacterium]|nr:MAG: glutamate synthase [Hyphomicrobiales bacterium]
MFRKPLMALTGLSLLLAISPVRAGEPDMAALTQEGKEVMMGFGTALKAELVKAMKEGGPTKAIPVCNVEAPKLAKMASDKSGWAVGRSSHKLRNSKNTPDPFTRAAIDDFLAREAAGEKADKMIKTAIVEEGGQKVFRLVKAIPTAKPCLNCHGGAGVKPKVVEALAKLYPDDAARGFSEGQMRGVFTLSKVLK